MRLEGLEPPRAFAHTDLNRARRPIPPQPLADSKLARASGLDSSRPSEHTIEDYVTGRTYSRHSAALPRHPRLRRVLVRAWRFESSPPHVPGDDCGSSRARYPSDPDR